MTSRCPILPRIPKALAIAAMGIFLSGGCGLEPGGLLAKHFSKDRRADAKRNWDGMRGGAHLQLAERHLDAGRLDEAEKETKQAVEMSPNAAAVHALAARIALERGQLAQARESVTKARSLSKDPENDYLAGIVAERYDDPAGALDLYTQASQKSPLVSEYILARAEMLVALGRPVDAIDAIESRLADFDRNVPMRCLAARLERSMDLKGPAVDRAREAVRLCEGDDAVLAECGDVMVWAGAFDDAIDVLRPVFDRCANPPASAKRNIVDASGRPVPETSKARERTITKRALLADVAGNLARAYLGTNQYRAAADVLDAQHTGTRDIASAVLRARAAIGLGDFDGAAAALKTAAPSDEPNAESLLLLAYAEFHGGHFSEARRSAMDAIAADDRLTPAYCLLGKSAQALGQFEEARRAYCDALAIEPGCRVATALLSKLSRSMDRSKTPTASSTAPHVTKASISPSTPRRPRP